MGILTYAVLAATIKKQFSSITFWAIMWGTACSLAITERHFHQQWLVLAAQVHGDGRQFLCDTASNHYHSLYGGVSVAIVILLTPVAWYWVERRKAQSPMC